MSDITKGTAQKLSAKKTELNMACNDVMAQRLVPTEEEAQEAIKHIEAATKILEGV